MTESGFVFEGYQLSLRGTFFLFTGFSHDGIGFCFGVLRRDRFFLGRAFVPVVFLTTESVFVLGVHDESGFF